MNISRLSYAAALLLVSTTLLSGCDNPDAAATEVTATADIARIPVATVALEPTSITSMYRTTATLEAREETDVTSKVNGIVEQILVEEGDYVEKGQVLAILRDDEYAITAAQAAAEYASIESELNRMKEMAARQMVSADAYDKLRFQLDMVKAKLDMAQLNLTETRIVAPIAGHIATRYVKVGNLVKQYTAQTLFHIVDQDRLQGLVHLPEHELRHINVGQTAQLRVNAYPSEVFTATVERMSPVVDSRSGTFKVVVAVENLDHHLKAGMFGQLQLHYATRDDVLVVPRYALVMQDGQPHLYVVNSNGEAEKRAVTLGFENDNQVEITAGLQPSDVVVVTGQNNLKDKALVTVIDGPAGNQTLTATTDTAADEAL